MRISETARLHAGMTARLEEEIVGQKAVVRRIDQLTDISGLAAARSRLARLEDMMTALRKQSTHGGRGGRR